MWRLAALLHDAPEYVTGDMASSVKSAVESGIGELDVRPLAAISVWFRLPVQITRKAQRQKARCLGLRNIQFLPFELRKCAVLDDITQRHLGDSLRILLGERVATGEWWTQSARPFEIEFGESQS